MKKEIYEPVCNCPFCKKELVIVKEYFDEGEGYSTEHRLLTRQQYFNWKKTKRWKPQPITIKINP